MADKENGTTSTIERTADERTSAPERFLEAGTTLADYANLRPVPQPSFRRQILSPLGILIISIILMVSLVSYGVGASMVKTSSSDTTVSNSTTTSTSSSDMGMGSSSSSTTTANANVPNATQNYGNQLAKYVIDPDGAKHFTFTAKQVMWEAVKGYPRVLAWTLDGTVPGPVIRVTAGDHVRITLTNHFPVGTALHWHGLLVPTDADGVPGVGMKPIMPGQTYTYDFTVHDQDVGTHMYHSHYDDMVQVPGGLYGSFIVDPRPGTAQAQQAIQADVVADQFVSELGQFYVINGKSFPDTQVIHVKHGQTVHMRIYGIGEMIHPMHLHGHTFNLVAQDGHMLPQPQQKDTIEVVPGETYDITFTAWAVPGSIYPFHCHILSHVMNPGQTDTEMGGLITLIEYDK
jgi:manganese oxidase